MGLEAVNFFFRSHEPIREILECNSEIVSVEDKRYVYRKGGEFWIDIELQDDFCLSIRIALCNPMDITLMKLDNLLLYLFKNGGVLYNLHTKDIFKWYDEDVKRKLIFSYEMRKKVFGEIYHDFEAAVSSEEFYRIQHKKRGIRDNNI